MQETNIRFGVRGKNQLPLFMVWKEYIEGGEVIFAKVLFNTDNWPRTKEFIGLAIFAACMLLAYGILGDPPMGNELWK